MPRQKFVREIKAQEVKNINPSDIIYLAMKDGSIILIADDDEDLIEYDDIKLNINTAYNKSNKKEQKNINDKPKINLNFSFDMENNNNFGNNNFVYTSKDNNNRTNSTSFRTINKVDNKQKTYSNNDKSKKENERMNRSINYSNSNYRINSERLDSSFDSICIPKKHHAYHVVEYFNDTKDSFFSNKHNSNHYEKPQIKKDNFKSNNIINNKEIIHRRKINTFIYDNNKRNNSQVINISDISIDSDTNYIEKDRKYKDYFNKKNKEYNYRNINTFNKKNQIRSQSLSNRNHEPQNTYLVQKKEMEIMGKIVNDKNSYRLIDHKHPHTLFESKCPFCQNLARDNKLCLCNIKEESIYDNHSFLASFGDSEKKRGRSQNNHHNKSYYL
jgi:hypothetical protein